MSHIFISHVEEDADIALEVALGLEEAGYTTWCYELDSIPGPSYLLQTGQAIEQSEAVVIVISPHSLGSHQVTREIVRAYEGAKRFIPLLRDITHVEFQNRQPEWREAVGAATSISISQEGLAGVITRVVDGLKALGIQPSSQADTARIERIRKMLVEPTRDTGEAAREVKKVAAETQPAGAAKLPMGEISNWWWSLPILTGFVGGIVAWVRNKGADQRKALYMLILGVLISFLWAVPIVVLTPGTSYIFPSGPLSISQTIFCSEEPEGPDVYTLQPDSIYYIGDTVWVYYEVWSYAARQEEQGYTVWLEAADRILDPQSAMYFQWPVYEYRETTPDLLDPDYVAFWDSLIIPQDAETGQYQFEVTVKDRWTGETVSQSGYFTIAPAESQEP